MFLSKWSQNVEFQGHLVKKRRKNFGQIIYIRVLALFLISRVTLGKLLNLSESQFLYLKQVEIANTSLQGF